MSNIYAKLPIVLGCVLTYVFMHGVANSDSYLILIINLILMSLTIKYTIGLLPSKGE